MKKKIFIILLLTITLLTGCKNKQEESLKKQEDLVKEELKEISNINQNKLKENLEYVKNNYEKVSDKETFDKVAYSTKYIQTIGIYEEKNDLEILADNATKYLKNQNKTNLENLKKSFTKIDGKEEKLIEELYNSYMKNEIVRELIENKKDIVSADLNDNKLLTYDNINTYYVYIENHINKPFKNNEVIEYLVYYGLYFQNSNKDNKLKELGSKTINYLQTLDNKTLTEIQAIIKEINQNKKTIINAFIS